MSHFDPQRTLPSRLSFLELVIRLGELDREDPDVIRDLLLEARDCLSWKLVPKDESLPCGGYLFRSRAHYLLVSVAQNGDVYMVGGGPTGPKTGRERSTDLLSTVYGFVEYLDLNPMIDDRGKV